MFVHWFYYLSVLIGCLYLVFMRRLIYTFQNVCPFDYTTFAVIGSDIHTSVYNKRDDFGFPIINFPWLSGDVPRLPSYDIYISQLVRFARCCTSVLDFHSKNLQITSKLLTQGNRYHKLNKTFKKFFRSYSELTRNLVIFRSKNMCLRESLTCSSTVI